MEQIAEVGRFGGFGGRFVPETLMPALEELEAAYDEVRVDSAFQAELADILEKYVGRPTPLLHARRLPPRPAPRHGPAPHQRHPPPAPRPSPRPPP